MSGYEMQFDILPGTSIPLHRDAGAGADNQSPSYGAAINPERMPVSLFQKLADRDDISPAEFTFVAAAIRAYADKPRKVKTIYQGGQGVTDGTTGNLVLPLFIGPAGCEAHVTQVTADTPNSATINPSAPFANAASFMFLAITSQATGDQSAAQATTYRRGLAAFAPTSAGGPILPGQWTFNRNASPVVFGGDELSLVIVGGSVAGILSTTVRVRYRIELEGYEQ